MFFNHLAKRPKRGGETKIGRWNTERTRAKRIGIIERAGALNGRVLEIGPGEGYLAQYCKEAGIDYTGLERSPGLRALQQEQGYKIVAGSAPNLPFEDEQFDSVVFIHVLEHMATFEEALQLLQQCNRVLTPSGKIAVEVPDYIRSGIDFYHWDYTHSFMTTPYRVRQALDDAGFEIEKIVHFAGGLTGFARIVPDLVGLFVQTRAAYWFASVLGFEKWIYKFHKTFTPTFLVIAKRVGST